MKESINVGKKDKDKVTLPPIPLDDTQDLNSLRPACPSSVVKEFSLWEGNPLVKDDCNVTLTIPGTALFLGDLIELFNLAKDDFPDLDPKAVLISRDHSGISFLWNRDAIPDCYTFVNKQSRVS